METAVAIWNFLWENQAILVLPVALILWIVVRGYDLGKWISKKSRKKEADAGSEPIAAGSEGGGNQPVPPSGDRQLSDKPDPGQTA